MALIAVVLIAGGIAYMKIPKEAQPDIPIPQLLVQVSYPGVSPEDSARLLVKPLETALNSVEGIKIMTSRAYQGMAIILLEFDVNFDKRKALEDVRAQVDEARSRHRLGLVVVDDRQHLVRPGVRQVRIHFVGVHERQEVDAPDLGDALDLLQLEPQELHERAVLAMAHLLDVPDRRLRHAQPLREVCLRDRARDPVGIGVTAQRDEHVLAASGAQRIGEGARTLLRRGRPGGSEPPDRFVHRGPNCGHVWTCKSRWHQPPLESGVCFRKYSQERCQPM